MPRRRKRKISEGRLQPLMFTESPVNIVHRMPSPVFASDNPAKAEVVPLDVTNDVPWISPQFVGVPGSIGRPRRTRRTRSGTGTLTMTHSRVVRSQAADSTHLAKTFNPAKYKALRFIGEETEQLSPESSQEVNISVDDEIDIQIEHKNPTKCDTQLQSTKDKINFTPREEPSSVVNPNDIDIETPPGNLDPQDDVDEPHRDPHSLPSGCGRTSFSSSNLGPVDVGTQHRPKRDRTKHKPHKKLFVTENDTSLTLNKLQADSSTTGVDNAFNTIPTRRSLRCQRLKENFFPNSQHCCTPENQRCTPVTVLVYDTPERDYGLPVRQRRLRELQIPDS